MSVELTTDFRTSVFYEMYGKTLIYTIYYRTNYVTPRMSTGDSTFNFNLILSVLHRKIDIIYRWIKTCTDQTSPSSSSNPNW